MYVYIFWYVFMEGKNAFVYRKLKQTQFIVEFVIKYLDYKFIKLNSKFCFIFVRRQSEREIGLR